MVRSTRMLAILGPDNCGKALIIVDVMIRSELLLLAVLGGHHRFTLHLILLFLLL